jgi:putative phage-type endonuclease
MQRIVAGALKEKRNEDHMTIETNNREDWLVERRKWIGASDAGTILGLNPHESPMSLYLRKRGELENKEETLAMWLGHEMEPVIAKRYKMETGRQLHDPGDYAILHHPVHEWLCATRDRTTTLEDGEHIPVELKAPGDRMAKDWSDTESPLCYQVQLQIQMACMGATRGEIAAIVGNQNFYCIRHERDDAFLQVVVPVLYEFWQGVQNGTPPEVDGTESTRKAIRALHPNDNGKTLYLPEEFESQLARLTELEIEIDEMSLEAQAIKNKIMFTMGVNTYAFLNGERVFSYKTQKSSTGKLSRILRRVK